jgi:hypothetical protein
MLVWDEPNRPDFFDVREVSDWIRENYPELLTYGNMSTINRPSSNYGQAYGTAPIPGGGYEDPPVPYDYDIFVDDYMYVVQPDVLQFDVYPWSDDPSETPDQHLRDRSYYRGAEIIRRAGLKANVPYFMFVQSFDGGGTYMPSESDLRMQLFSALAYGFKGISYFIYDHFGAYGDGTSQGGLLRATHPCECVYTRNPLYYSAQAANLELLAVGETLKYLESTQVRYIVGKHLDGGTGPEVPNQLPLGVTAWNAGTDDPYITNIQATNAGTIPGVTEGDLLVGHFKPASDVLPGLQCDDDTYFMIVNLLREKNVSAADASQLVHVEFDFGSSGITRLWNVSRVTGALEDVPLVHDGGAQYHLDLILSGGTGELFKYEKGGVPELTGAQPGSSGPELSFLACQGVTYHVDQTDDPLADPVTWTQANSVSDAAGPTTLTNPPSPETSLIYRLRGSQ